MDKIAKIKAEIERRLLPTVRDKHYDEWEEGGNNALINILSFINSLPEEPVSKDLEEAAWMYYDKNKPMLPPEFALHRVFVDFFKAGAKWQKDSIWKPADGDDLPEIDREVIVLLDNGKVVFAHRPPEYWDGKDIVTGKVTRHYPKTYDKGGWNIPNVKYWLDVELPKEIEL